MLGVGMFQRESDLFMSSIDPKVLAKIKKCMALATSCNPNEAATALRQAHALMAKHGVSAHEVTMSDIGEASAKSCTMSRDKPAHWETRLAALVGKAFGCQLMVSRTKMVKGRGYVNEGAYIFVGLKHQAEVASYTASVLIRKCKSARASWIAEHLSGLGRGVKGGKSKLTRMGDMFAEGWVESIGALVHEFANPPEVEDAIKKCIESQVTGKDDSPTRSVKSEEIGRHERLAVAMGMKSAQGVALYRPMGGEAQVTLLG